MGLKRNERDSSTFDFYVKRYDGEDIIIHAERKLDYNSSQRH